MINVGKDIINNKKGEFTKISVKEKENEELKSENIKISKELNEVKIKMNYFQNWKRRIKKI